MQFTLLILLFIGLVYSTPIRRDDYEVYPLYITNKLQWQNGTHVNLTLHTGNYVDSQWKNVKPNVLENVVLDTTDTKSFALEPMTTWVDKKFDFIGHVNGKEVFKYQITKPNEDEYYRLMIDGPYCDSAAENPWTDSRNSFEGITVKIVMTCSTSEITLSNA